MYILRLSDLDVEHLIKEYIFHISVFRSKDIPFDDVLLNKKIKDLQDYIDERIGE